MKCSHCQYPETRVVESRPDGDDMIRRRRECMRCGSRFTTQENLRLPKKPVDDRFAFRARKKGAIA